MDNVVLKYYNCLCPEKTDFWKHNINGDNPMELLWSETGTCTAFLVSGENHHS